MHPSPRSAWIIVAALAAAILACGPMSQPTISPTAYTEFATSTIPTATAGPVGGTIAPGLTPAPVCSPPNCGPGEVVFCPPDSCTNGCGATCATVTPGGAVTPAAGPLSTGGPWLVFLGDADGFYPPDSLWAVGEDGSGLTTLVQNTFIPAPVHIAAGVSPSGGHIAFLTASDEVGHNLALSIVTLPGAAVQQITPLTSSETEISSGDPSEDPNVEVLRAMTEVDSLAWSPDGTRLAFMGAMQGATSDLYVYSLVDGSITQLSSGPSQAIAPSWSPDGRYIVHFGVGTLGTGAGASMEGAWAADTTTGEIISLYTPETSGEEVVGWIGDSTVLIRSWTPDCGWTRLAAFDIPAGASEVLWDGCFNEVAYDSAGGTLMFAVEYVGSSEDDVPGVFLLTLSSGQLVRLDESPARDVEWSPQLEEYFALTEDAVLAFTREGQSVALPQLDAGLPVVSPDGSAWAWPSAGFDSPEGVWLGPVSADMPPDQVFYAGDIVLWSPDSRYLFIASGPSLWVISTIDPALNPLEVSSSLHYNGPWEGPAWLMP